MAGSANHHTADRGAPGAAPGEPRLPSASPARRRSEPSVSVCFPAYNEEATIGDVLREAHQLLSQSGSSYEIIVCDDGSVDRTGAVIDELACELPFVKVLRHPRNLGIRATFEDLYAAASNDYVFLNSTDRQWKTDILFDMLPLTDQWDVIVARRIDKHYGLVRGVVSWAFNRIPVLLFGVDTFDAGAVKLTKREIIQRFDLVSRSPFSEAERLIRAARAGYRITQQPVEVAMRRTGRSHGVSLALVREAVADLWRVWWSLYREGNSGRWTSAEGKRP
jgi:glycosyltransferase involved in cell wall biosynthesis